MIWWGKTKLQMEKWLFQARGVNWDGCCKIFTRYFITSSHLQAANMQKKLSLEDAISISIACWTCCAIFRYFLHFFSPKHFFSGMRRGGMREKRFCHKVFFFFSLLLSFLTQIGTCECWELRVSSFWHTKGSRAPFWIPSPAVQIQTRTIFIISSRMPCFNSDS